MNFICTEGSTCFCGIIEGNSLILNILSYGDSEGTPSPKVKN